MTRLYGIIKESKKANLFRPFSWDSLAANWLIKSLDKHLAKVPVNSKFQYYLSYIIQLKVLVLRYWRPYCSVKLLNSAKAWKRRSLKTNNFSLFILVGVRSHHLVIVTNKRICYAYKLL